jgi:hypothetical protein
MAMSWPSLTIEP